MARIRSVHPGLWTDEAFVSLPDAAALLFIGLWNEADDNGVFEWKPLTIKMRLRPATTETPADIDESLLRIQQANLIMRFEDGGRQYGAVRNFARYQRPKSPKGVHPCPAEVRKYVGLTDDGKRPHAETGRPSSDPSGEAVPNDFGSGSEISPQREEEGGKREEGEERRTDAQTKQPPLRLVERAPERADLPYGFEAKNIRLSRRDLEAWRKAFPNLSLEAELWALDEWAGEQGRAVVSGSVQRPGEAQP